MKLSMNERIRKIVLWHSLLNRKLWHQVMMQEVNLSIKKIELKTMFLSFCAKATFLSADYALVQIIAHGSRCIFQTCCLR